MIGLAAAAPARQLEWHNGDGTRLSDGSQVMAKDILALICPDWRGPMLALDARSGDVLYANLPCLSLFERRGPANLLHSRLTFGSPEFDHRFNTNLNTAVERGIETAVTTGYDPATGSWISATIRNTQGFFRDTLLRNLHSRDSIHPVVVEISLNTGLLDPLALAAFALASGLAPAEIDAVRCLAAGQTPADIAAARGVATSTVRQRLKSVLAKTRSRRQAELIRLVMAMCPAVPDRTAT